MRDLNRRYFREAYRTGEHRWPVTEPSPEVVRALERLKHEMPGGRLLDLGCGEGRHAIAAAELGFRVTGIDFEPLALRRARDQARRAGVKGILFRRADVLCLPFRNDSFDVVIDYGCLHHQRKSDWPAYLSGLLRVLAPRGDYVLTVFSPRFSLFLGSRRPWHRAYGSYRRAFTRRDLLGLFGRDFEFLDLTEDRARGFWHALLQRRI